MNIRAHHILCMKYFQGKGYSEEFVSNFRKVITQLEENPTIKVINHIDIICKSCPHNNNNKCTKKLDSEEKVRRKDNQIAKILGITLNKEIKAKEAANLVNLNLTELKQTCKDCQWKKYCN